MIALCFGATAINYIDRANLGVAAVAIQTELKIDPAIMGIILGGFFWTYALMQMPAGYLIDRFGPRPMYAIAVGWWSVFTAVTALATVQSHQVVRIKHRLDRICLARGICFCLE